VASFRTVERYSEQAALRVWGTSGAWAEWGEGPNPA
jgi:hypothetical protein